MDALQVDVRELLQAWRSNKMRRRLSLKPGEATLLRSLDGTVLTSEALDRAANKLRQQFSTRTAFCEELARTLKTRTSELRAATADLSEQRSLAAILRGVAESRLGFCRELADKLLGRRLELGDARRALSESHAEAARTSDRCGVLASSLRRKGTAFDAVKRRLRLERGASATAVFLAVAALLWLLARRWRRLRSAATQQAKALVTPRPQQFKHEVHDVGGDKVVRIECPCVRHIDVKLCAIFNGVRVAIRREASLGVEPFRWEHEFQFQIEEGHFELKEDENKLEAGCLYLVFRPYPSQPRQVTLPLHPPRAPQHFVIASDPEDCGMSAAVAASSSADKPSAPAQFLTGISPRDDLGACFTEWKHKQTPLLSGGAGSSSASVVQRRRRPSRSAPTGNRVGGASCRTVPGLVFAFEANKGAWPSWHDRHHAKEDL